MSSRAREGVPTGFYIGDWNYAGVQRGCPTTYPNTYLHFWVPERLAARHEFSFSGRVVGQGAPNSAPTLETLTNQLGYVYKRWPFSVHLNGVQKFSTGGLPDQTPYSFTIAPGELKAGWNVITHRIDAGATCWTCWDFFKFEFEPIPSGTMMIIR